MLVAAGAAWAGLVLGHALSYLLAYPSGPERHVQLLATGHRWLGPAVLSLGAAVPAVLVAAASRAVRTGASSPRGLLPRLAAVQTAAFLAIEVAERGFDLAWALTDPAVLLGLVIQVAVAAAATLVLGTVTAAVRLATRHPRRPTRDEQRPRRPGPGTAPVVRPAFLVRARRRAPPIPLAA